MAIVFLGLGSNLGDKSGNIREAVVRLSDIPTIHVAKVSSLYETAPVGVEDQPDFLNAVAQVETDLPPLELLQIIMKIEKDMGRVRNLRWGPRVIDIDILIYDEIRMDTEELILPHPRMMERAFVLAPLAEIAPELRLPSGKTSEQALSDLPDQKVRKISEVA